jgi:hypothetical protein
LPAAQRRRRAPAALWPYFLCWSSAVVFARRVSASERFVIEDERSWRRRVVEESIASRSESVRGDWDWDWS